MAAARWTQKLLFKVTAAAIPIFLALFLPAVWGSSAAAVAGAAPTRTPASGEAGEASGIIVAWDEEAENAPSLSALSNQCPEVGKLLAEMPQELESIEESKWVAPHTQAFDLPEGTPIEEALEAFSAVPGVRYVEPDTLIKADDYPVSPYSGNQWYIPRIGAEKAWESEVGRDDLTVAVLDSGVDGSHPDLAGRVLAGFNFINKSGDTADLYGHGTHVAGIIAAAGNDGYGIAGLAWRVRILPVKVLDDKGCGTYSDLIAGIRYAADSGASVINMSLGGGARSQALQEAVDYARSRGAVLVAAAGNEALEGVSYPAACDGVISVGATDNQDNLASFTNHGEGLDLVAPGVGIYSDVPGGRCAYKSGTSMAAPQVAGAFALLRSREPGLNAAEAERRVLSSAQDLGSSGYDLQYGWGLLKADRALDAGQKTPAGQMENAGELYFAEGYTGEGFDTYILLENPGEKSSTARMELYGGQGPAASLEVQVAPHARQTLRLNDLVPPGDVAARISLAEGSEIRAQRSMYFDYRGIRGGHTSQPGPASRTFYFAEGYTGPGYDTYLLIFNPQTQTARVDLGVITAEGMSHLPVEVPPLTRSTMRLNDAFPGMEMALSLFSDQAVVAERAMYFTAEGRNDGSCSVGATDLSEEWYFAEGYTGGDFDEWLLLANPTSSAVTARLDFQRQDGLVVERDIQMRPFSRFTVHADEIEGLEAAEISTLVRASSPGVVAERSMYFNGNGCMGRYSGGHAALGSTGAASHWLLPEGYTGEGFESWILISNLEDRAVSVQVSLFGESGSTVRREYLVGAHSRFTVKENDLLRGEGVSAEISAPDGTKLVVEGAFYFRYRGGIDGGST